MIAQPIFKSFVQDVLKAVKRDGGNVEIQDGDPQAVFRGVAAKKTMVSNQDRPPRAAYSRPAMTRLTTNYDPQVREDKIGSIKTALIERLVRLGATDVEDLPGMKRFIKSTPRLFMKHRSPEELKALEKSVHRGFRKVEAPLERKLHKATAGMSKNTKKVIRAGGKMLIRNPETIATQPIPVPGISYGLLGAKKGLERLIDKLAPA